MTNIDKPEHYAHGEHPLVRSHPEEMERYQKLQDQLDSVAKTMEDYDLAAWQGRDAKRHIDTQIAELQERRRRIVAAQLSNDSHARYFERQAESLSQEMADIRAAIENEAQEAAQAQEEANLAEYRASRGDRDGVPWSEGVPITVDEEADIQAEAMHERVHGPDDETTAVAE